MKQNLLNSHLQIQIKELIQQLPLHTHTQYTHIQSSFSSLCTPAAGNNNHHHHDIIVILVIIDDAPHYRHQSI
jgi:hypothetical protein